mgnify:CR=1 FL=1
MSNFKFMEIDQLLKELDKYSFKQLHLHHTWKPSHKNFNGQNHIKLQEGMKEYHLSLGWKDIGQHLTLFPDGKWLTGRPFHMTPASIRGWNKGALAVEMVGNFDLPGTGVYNELGYDRLKGRQREEILKLIKYFIDKYGEDTIVFHRDHPTAGKTCPGTSLDKRELIEEAKKLDKNHWGEKYYYNLAKKGILLDEKRYDDFMTRAEAMALVDKIMDRVMELIKEK